MPGGYGGYDIYVVEKLEEGWGAPKNLGYTGQYRETGDVPLYQLFQYTLFPPMDMRRTWVAWIFTM
jgi:hypothetical protein